MKQATKTGLFIVGAFLVLGVLAVYLGVIPIGPQVVTPTGVTPTPTVAANISNCPTGTSSNTSPEVKVSAKDAENVGTDITDINGDLYLQATDGTWVSDKRYSIASDDTIDVPVGTPWKIYLYDIDDYNYSGSVETGTACVERVTINPKMEDISHPILRLFNTDDSLINATGDRQAIGSGGSASMSAKLSEEAEDDFYGSCKSGAPSPIMVFDANYDTYDEIKPEGIGATPIGVPNGHSTDRTRCPSCTGSAAYLLGGMTCLKSYESTTFTLKAEADTGLDPGAYAADTNFLVYIYTPVLARNTETNEISWYYRNPVSGVALFPAHITTVWVS